MTAILALDKSRRNVAARTAGASSRERGLAAVVLHGSWQPSYSGQLGAFFVWGESWRGRPARRPSERSGATAKRVRLHPFAASIEDLRASLAELGSGLEPSPADSSVVILRLPSSTGSPLASPDLPSAGDAKTGAVELKEWRAPALHFRPEAAARLLLSLAPACDGLRARLGGSARFWISPAQLCLDLLHRQRFLPVLREEGGAIVARWVPQFEDLDTQRIAELARVLPPVCRAATTAGDEALPSSRELVRSFVAAIVDGFARESLSKQPLPKRGATRRGGAGRSVCEAWLTALSGDPVLAGDEPALARFYERYRDWLAPAYTTSVDGESFRVCFRLEPPEESPPDASSAAVSHRDWTLRYLLQATDDPSLLVPAAQVWRQRGSTAKLLDRKLQNPQEHLLRGLGAAARIVPAVETSLREAAPVASRLTTEEAYDFVRERALLLKSSGFGVLVPGFDAQLGVRVTLGRRTTDPARASGTASFGWESLVSFDWKLALGDATLTREELEALARLKQPLVQIRGRWVELRREQIAQALAFFSRKDAGELTLRDALGLTLAPGEQTGLPVVDVAAEGWFAELLDQLRQPVGRDGLTEPPGFVGSLRGYQRTGVAWLSTLRSFGLGACLADDMGLG
ncbi:MAG: hypothetical protein HY329_10840, partial [Chloroflexi bacterium]|nr:hypothetical protein [Chloroflexota bacterium]